MTQPTEEELLAIAREQGLIRKDKDPHQGSMKAFSDFARAVLEKRGAPQQAAPAGEASLLAEITPEMRKAAADAWLDCGSKLLLNKDAAALKAGIAAAPKAAPKQAAAANVDDAKDAARWRWLGAHIQAAWDEGKFTSLVRIVSDSNRAALNASIDRMMSGDWSDADRAAPQQAAQEPFKPDWMNYKTGFASGMAEAREQVEPLIRQMVDALEQVQADCKSTPNAYEAQRRAITAARAWLKEGGQHGAE